MDDQAAVSESSAAYAKKSVADKKADDWAKVLALAAVKSAEAAAAEEGASSSSSSDDTVRTTTTTTTTAQSAPADNYTSRRQDDAKKNAPATVAKKQNVEKQARRHEEKRAMNSVPTPAAEMMKRYVVAAKMMKEEENKVEWKVNTDARVAAQKRKNAVQTQRRKEATDEKRDEVTPKKTEAKAAGVGGPGADGVLDDLMASADLGMRASGAAGRFRRITNGSLQVAMRRACRQVNRQIAMSVLPVDEDPMTAAAAFTDV